MRVLVLNHTSSISGGERSLLDLLDGLPEQVSVVVACPSGPLAEAVRARDVEWLRIPGTEASLRLHPVWTTRALIALARSRRRVREAVRDGGFDVVHANSLRAGLLCARMPRPPRVVFVRDVLPQRMTARVAASVVARGPVRVLANSHFTADRFAEQTGRRARVEV
ncbi:MAG: glycosyltransferase family 4 protein, partial [Actinomycetota bacterium]|nr:glycosyltransferase family 4 protein [Actinomycetota bacterium]